MNNTTLDSLSSCHILIQAFSIYNFDITSRVSYTALTNKSSQQVGQPDRPIPQACILRCTYIIRK